MKESVECEGFIETDPGNKEGMNLIMVRPVFQMTHPGNVGGIDALVEELWSDLTCGDELSELSDNSLNNSETLRTFKAAKEGRLEGEGILYWRRVFEWDRTNDDYFIYTVRAGAGADRKATS